MAKKVVTTPKPGKMENISLPEIGQMIKHNRTVNNVKIEEVANYLGMSRTTIVNIENGSDKISVKNLFKLMSEFGVQINLSES